MNETFEESWKKQEEAIKPSDLRSRMDEDYENKKNKRPPKHKEPGQKVAFDLLARTDGVVEAIRVFGPREELSD